MTLSTISTRFPLLFSVKCFRLTRGQRCNKVIVPHEGHTRAFSRGSQRILGQELLDALTFAGCQTLRIQSYGMKTKIPAGFDLGDPNHPLSHTNCFDIGQNLPPVRTYPPLPSVMKLFRGRDELGLAGVTLQKYPMLQHLGFHNNMWYGSVHVSVQPRHENDDPLKFKVYPRLVQFQGYLSYSHHKNHACISMVLSSCASEAAQCDTDSPKDLLRWNHAPRIDRANDPEVAGLYFVW